MFATTARDFISTRETVPSPWLSVQMEPAPAVRKRGPGPTAMVSVTALDFASTRVTTLFSGLLTQIAPSPYTQATDPGATAISAATWFVAGSMRESVPLISVTIHTASGDATMPPSLFAGPTGMVATT